MHLLDDPPLGDRHEPGLGVTALDLVDVDTVRAPWIAISSLNPASTHALDTVGVFCTTRSSSRLPIWLSVGRSGHHHHGHRTRK